MNAKRDTNWVNEIVPLIVDSSLSSSHSYLYNSANHTIIHLYFDGANATISKARSLPLYIIPLEIGSYW